MDKVREVVDEFRTVVAGRVKVVDSVLPPLLFVLINGLAGADWAVGAALGASLLLAGWRRLRGEPMLYALLGLGGAAFAYLLVRLVGRAEGFFLPGIFTSGLTALLAVISNLARRPLVAWSSVIARRWPLGWYWHPKVRPAYAEVTWLWAIFFGARALLQLSLFQAGDAGGLALANILSGWPALIVLLVVTYLYGTWRLGNLAGPSVQEFEIDAPPPWSGQRKGF